MFCNSRDQTDPKKIYKKTALSATGIPLFSAIKPLPSESNEPVKPPLDWLGSESFSIRGAPTPDIPTPGVTWPPLAKRRSKERFQLYINGQSNGKSVQSWPLAYWPDGSLKWTARALGGAEVAKDHPLQLKVGKAKKTSDKPLTKETSDILIVNTCKLECVIDRKGNDIFQSLSKEGIDTAKNAKLVLLLQQQARDDDEQSSFSVSKFEGRISNLTVEQNGPVRAVVK